MFTLKWALIFLVIAVIAGAFGFTGVARGAATLSRIFFAVFLILAVVVGILAMTVFHVASSP